MIILIFTILLFFYKNQIPKKLMDLVPVLFSATGFILILKAFSETNNLYVLMFCILLNHVFVTLSITLNETIHLNELLIYWSGIGIGCLICTSIIFILKGHYLNLNILEYNGIGHHMPKLAFVFLLGCLMLTGFPISSTFLGEDLFFSHINPNQFALVIFISLSFIIDGLALIRLYSRLFLGPVLNQPQLNSYKRA